MCGGVYIEKRMCVKLDVGKTSATPVALNAFELVLNAYRTSVGYSSET